MLLSCLGDKGFCLVSSDVHGTEASWSATGGWVALQDLSEEGGLHGLGFGVAIWTMGVGD